MPTGVRPYSDGTQTRMTRKRMTRWPLRTPRRLPLRQILIAILTSQILAVAGTIGYFSFRAGQQAVQGLSSQLRSELTARIERELQSYFETPHELNRLNAAAMLRNDINVVTASRGEGLLYQQMKIAQAVAFVYCGSTQRGEFFGVLRSPETGALQLSYSNADTGFLRRYYRLNNSGDRTRRIRTLNTPYDARQRPWFQSAIARQGPSWTDIYVAFTTGLPNITASLPVYSRSGRNLIGVCGADVVLPEEFRRFLQRLDIGKTGQAFVIDRSGTLIANSTDEPLVRGEGDEITSVMAADSQDTLVSGTARYLLGQFGEFEQIQTRQQLDFYLAEDRQAVFNRQRQFLEVVPFNDGFGIDWLIVVVVPERDFMGQIYTSTRNSVLLTLLSLSAAVGGGFVVARWLTRPMGTMTQATKAMAGGDLEQRVAVEGRIAEMSQLAQAFNSMATQLQASFAAVEQSEATNRAIVASIPDLLIRADRDGTYIDIAGSDGALGAELSPRLRAIHGVQNFSPGRSVWDSLPPELAERRMHHIHQALATGEMQVYEQRLTIGDQPQDEEVRVLVLSEDEVLIMVRDITARKQNQRLREENLHLGAELDIARQIQRMILPKGAELASVEGLDIAGYMEPADEVGGDYYDVLQADGVVTIGIGDVTGHGLESGLLMLMTQTSVRTLNEIRERDAVRFLDTLNRTIYRNVHRMGTDRNLTLAILNYAQGQLSISGQHEETLVVRADGSVERIDTMDLGLPIGLDDDIAEFVDHLTVALAPGDGVVLYTDGITEAYNLDKNQYGLDRLCGFIGLSWQGTAEQVKQAIIEDLRRFIGKQKVFDDITLLVVKRR